MNKVGDLTGKRFGKLKVLEYTGMLPGYQKTWKCECDCGNIKIIRQQHLMSGHTTTCGCGKPQFDNYVGRNFDYLTVLYRTEDYVCPGNGKHYVRYRCRCVCGTEKDVLALNLKNHGCISCGCKRPHAFVDLLGQRFGGLIVVKRIEDYVNPSGRKLVQYLCKCDCGNYIHALANNLRKYEVCSCGCKVYSRGEDLVSEWLNKSKFYYESHRTFAWCLSPTGHKMPYDFYVPKLRWLIECNGIQHYEPIEFFGGVEQFERQTEHDALKRQYALARGYNYTVVDCRSIDKENLIRMLDDFVLSYC